MMNSLVYKDKAGQQWFLGIYSNNFKDRESETFTWDSHLDYVEWVNKMGVKLPVTVAHQPQYPLELHVAQFVALESGKFTAQEFSDNYMKLYQPYAFAQTEAIIPVNGFVLVVAKILKGKENAVKLLNEVGWGMSHGFLALNRDQDTIKQYRTFEFTTLPPQMAANMLTVSKIQENTLVDATKALSEKDQETLKNLLNADPSQLEEGLGEMQRILSTVFDSKALDVEPTEEVVVEDNYEEIRTKIFADLNVEALQKSFNTLAQMLQDVTQRLDDYDARLKNAERSEDEKIAQALTDPFASLSWKLFDQELNEKPENADELVDKALGEEPIEGIGEKKVTADDNPLAWSVANIFS